MDRVLGSIIGLICPGRKRPADAEGCMTRLVAMFWETGTEGSMGECDPETRGDGPMESEGTVLELDDARDRGETGTERCDDA